MFYYSLPLCTVKKIFYISILFIDIFTPKKLLMKCQFKSIEGNLPEIIILETGILFLTVLCSDLYHFTVCSVDLAAPPCSGKFFVIPS